MQLKPAPAPRRRNPMLLIAAAAVVALAIVGVPLLLFSPGGEPGPATTPPVSETTVPETVTPTAPLPTTTAPTPTTVPSTEPPPTTTTIPEHTTPPMLVPGEASFDIDPAIVSATTAAGTVVIDAQWGDAPEQLGLLDTKQFGPCCFDISGDGTIVILDSQNLRLVVYPSSGAPPRVLATFDAADLVPEVVAVDEPWVYVVGMSNRPGRPYDVVVLDFGSGRLLARSETSLEINTDLRSTDFGDVFAGVMSSQPTWIRLTSNGEPLGADAEQAFGFLPGETSVGVTYDDGIEIIVQPAGDSPATTFDLPTDQFVLDVIPVPGAPDANGVLVVLTPSIGGDDPVTLLLLGTDRGELDVDALSIAMPRDVELGTFNTIRYGFGGVYVMGSTADGVQIVRYELP